MHMHRSRSILALGLGICLLPAFAFAQSDSMQTRIQSLLNEISVLRAQFSAFTGSSSLSGQSLIASTTSPANMTSCIMLSRNLRVGAQGDDVRELQQMLKAGPENGFTAAATGYFGPLTASAVAKYQIRMGIASSTDGSVGPLTRAFLRRACVTVGNVKTVVTPIAAVVTGNAPFIGTITQSSATNVTIKNALGKSIVVNISASTTILKGAFGASPPMKGSFADLIVGAGAAAQGTVNADGSIDASHIDVGTLPTAPLPSAIAMPSATAGGQAANIPAPPTGSNTAAPAGGHCDGASSSSCPSRYRCQLGPIADAGGVCMPI